MAVAEQQEISKSGLVLDSLEVINFRAFRHLTVEKLGRVNLITGKNNVGKSTLLEAIWLYIQNGSPVVIRQILSERNELTEVSSAADDEQMSLFSDHYERAALDSLRYIFNGRHELIDEGDAAGFTISELNSPDKKLSVVLDFFAEEGDVTGSDETDTNKPEYNPDANPYIEVQVGSHGPIVYRLDRILSRVRRSRFENVLERNQYVKVKGLNAFQLTYYWDRVSLTDAEEDVVTALKMIAPDIERVNFVSEKSSQSTRVPFVRLQNEYKPVPLSSFGDGVNRLFAVVLALINSRSGVLLLDEVDNGLHYTVLPNVWRLILQTARRLNVQVFATTHSWDCIQAFQEAVAEDDDPDSGVLVRLQNTDGDVTATVFDERELAIVTREGIEVR